MKKPLIAMHRLHVKPRLLSDLPDMRGRSSAGSSTKKNTIGQTEAKNQFVELCNQVFGSGQPVYVKDKRGISYLVLSAKPKQGPLEPIEVPVQRFKSHFSRFSYLVKDGISFKIQLHGGGSFIFARQDAGYREPLQDVIDHWIIQLQSLEPFDAGDEGD